MKSRKKKNAARRILSIKEVAAVLNLTVRRVQQLVQEGLPKKFRGRYDQDECTGWYIRYLQAVVEKKAIVDEGGKMFATEHAERLRLLRAETDLREIELSRERSHLVSIDEVDKALMELAVTTEGRILAIAPRLALEIVGETSRIMVHAKIEKAVKETLLHLSKREGRITERMEVEADA